MRLEQHIPELIVFGGCGLALIGIIIAALADMFRAMHGLPDDDDDTPRKPVQRQASDEDDD